jgi:hypothetical protein
MYVFAPMHNLFPLRVADGLAWQSLNYNKRCAFESSGCHGQVRLVNLNVAEQDQK